MFQLYRMHDTMPNYATPVSVKEAKKWNLEGYGIFFAIQEFHSILRRKHNLKSIRCWAIDIDNKELTKPEIIKLIYMSPIEPSLVIETKNGYHVYWLTTHKIKIIDHKRQSEEYTSFLSNNLIPFFYADPRASDTTRLLRMPFFFHMKDKNDPFLCKAVYKTNKRYTYKQMRYYFPQKKKPDKLKIYEKKSYSNHCLNNVKTVKIICLAEDFGIKLKVIKSHIIKGQCIYHEDSIPSVCFYPTNSFYCFGCKKGGTTIDFVSHYKKLSVKDSISYLRNYVKKIRH